MPHYFSVLVFFPRFSPLLNKLLMVCSDQTWRKYLVCRPDVKQTTLKMLVPWLEFGSLWAMLCLDVTYQVVRLHFPSHQLFFCPVSVWVDVLWYSCGCSQTWLFSSSPVLFMNVWISTSWCQHGWQYHVNSLLEFSFFNSFAPPSTNKRKFVSIRVFSLTL